MSTINITKHRFKAIIGITLMGVFVGVARMSHVSDATAKNSTKKTLQKPLQKLKSIMANHASTKNSLCLEKSTRKALLADKKTIPVFKRDGSKQCEPLTASHSPNKMKKNLEKSNIKVFKSIKGWLRNTRVPSVCGAKTGNINVFYIPAGKIKKAIKKGFKKCIRYSKNNTKM